MRRLLLVLVMFFAVASAATGVHASTDCERWFIAYKNSLAQTPAAKKLKLASHRVHRYVHRKLASYSKPKTAPKPKVLPTRARRPKMNREEMLRHFNLACGELPEDTPGTQILQAEDIGPDLFPGRRLHPDVSLEEAPGTTGLIASNTMPPYTPGESGSPNRPFGNPPGFGGGFGGGFVPGGSMPHVPGKPGGPGVPDSPGTPDSPSIPNIPSTPGIPSTPDNPDVPGSTLPEGPGIPVVVAPTPEPSSVVFLLTGIAGAAGMVRRRIRQQS